MRGRTERPSHGREFRRELLAQCELALAARGAGWSWRPDGAGGRVCGLPALRLTSERCEREHPIAETFRDLLQLDGCLRVCPPVRQQGFSEMPMFG